MFKINEKVIAYGLDGVIISIDTKNSLTYPIKARFSNNRIATFTLTGIHDVWHKKSELKKATMINKLIMKFFP